MREPNERSEKTRQKLLDAARDIVAEGGFNAVSNRAIANRAGVNLALISYHFGGQGKLMGAMIDRAVDEITARHAPLEGGEDIPAFAAATLEATRDVANDPSSRILIAAMLEALHNEEIAPAVRRNLRELRGFIGDVFKRSSRKGETESGLPTLIAAALDGLLLHTLLDPDTDAKAAAAAFKSLLH